MTENHNHPPSNRKSIWHFMFTVVAAAFGVQSDKNRQKDFSHSSPWPYIFGGLAFTVVFILILVFVVKAVIS